MSGDYNKIEINKSEKYEYSFNEPLTVADIVNFYSNIEKSNYFKYITYIVNVVSDSYEDGGYTFSHIEEIDPKIFDKWSVINGINMLGFVDERGIIGDSIHAAINENSIVVKCSDGGKVLDVVESSFPRQKKLN